MGTEPPIASPCEQNAPSVRGFPAGCHELFLGIQLEWNKAEEAIKRSEQVAIDVTIPSVSELRYAGRRIIDAMKLAGTAGDNDAKINALLEDARFCCHRSQHDAIDAALAKIGIDLDNLTCKLGFDPVIKAYPPFHEFYARFALAQEKVAGSRRKREDRVAIYETITAVDLPELIERYRAIMIVRPVAKKYARQQRLGSIIGWIILFMTAATMIFAAMAVDWAKWLPSHNDSVRAKATPALTSPLSLPASLAAP